MLVLFVDENDDPFLGERQTDPFFLGNKVGRPKFNFRKLSTFARNPRVGVDNIKVFCLSG